MPEDDYELTITGAWKRTGYLTYQWVEFKEEHRISFKIEEKE